MCRRSTVSRDLSTLTKQALEFQKIDEKSCVLANLCKNPHLVLNHFGLKQRHKLFSKSSRQEVAERAKETTSKAEQGWANGDFGNETNWERIWGAYVVASRDCSC